MHRHSSPTLAFAPPRRSPLPHPRPAHAAAHLSTDPLPASPAWVRALRPSFVERPDDNANSWCRRRWDYLLIARPRARRAPVRLCTRGGMPGWMRCPSARRVRPGGLAAH
jgi:hypothetical protein